MATWSTGRFGPSTTATWRYRFVCPSRSGTWSGPCANSPQAECTAARSTPRCALRDRPRSRLNQTALDGVLAVVEDIRRRVSAAGPVDPVELLRFPGVIQDDVDNLAEFKAAANASFGAAVDDLLEHRASEGANLDHLLRERLQAVEHTAARIRDLVASQAEVLREQLRRRVQGLAERIDADRMDQEIALVVQKADVAEELDRLDIHVGEARRSLSMDGPCGRRLDFLMQELNREANTLAAKSVLPEAARLAVDLKVVIEQMREQAQNVE